MKRKPTASTQQLSIRYDPSKVHPRVAQLILHMSGHDQFKDTGRRLTTSMVLRMAIMSGLASLEARFVPPEVLCSDG